jgi:hypothetical protein
MHVKKLRWTESSSLSGGFVGLSLLPLTQQIAPEEEEDLGINGCDISSQVSSYSSRSSACKNLVAPMTSFCLVVKKMKEIVESELHIRLLNFSIPVTRI